MSDVLTRPEDFRQAPIPPSMRSTGRAAQREFSADFRELLIADFLGANLTGISSVLTSPLAPQIASGAMLEAKHRVSLAALTERSVQTRREDFTKALIEAVKLSDALVAEEEAGPPNWQTWTYAIDALAALFISMNLPTPLILPLQNGGIGTEWHERGMNIELRFRNPYHVYAVLEDARGVIKPFHGRDPYLLHTHVALREFTTRAVD